MVIKVDIRSLDYSSFVFNFILLHATKNFGP